MKTPDARKFIGKFVEWDIKNSYFPTRRGIVEEVTHKNILVGGDWYWLPDIKELRIVEEKP